MQTTLVLVAKIALLVVLWLFIWITVRAMRKEVSTAAMAGPAGPGAAVGASVAAPAASGGRGFRRAAAPTSLQLVSGPLTGTTLNLQGYQEVSMGRSSSCTLEVEDDFASGTHARLMRRGDDWFLEDLDSRNGTFLNGQRIDQPERVAAGQELRVGQTTVRMEA
ncbi:MAG: FHA domain-containing protein FhaB/FipA [Mycobacteriaceae bacterium]|uniref:FHA domain-containing protein FhaB/FipA n=1 Tax=Corynebacterium sp. TaxID=1720 RepID=UPI003F98900B